MADRGAADSYYQGEPHGGNYQQPQQQMQYQPPSGPPPQGYNQGPPPQNYNQGPPPQNYNAPPPEYGYVPPNYDPNGNKLGFEDTFKVQKPKWNDLWAGILFLVVCGGFVAISVIAFRGYDQSRNNRLNFAINSKTGYLFLFVILEAWVVSYVYVWLARLFPKLFIWMSGIFNIVMGIGLAALLLIKYEFLQNIAQYDKSINAIRRKQYASGIIAVIFAGFTILCFISWIPRIPFSAYMLTLSINVSKKYGHVYIISLIGGFLAAAFAAYYAASLAAIAVHWNNNSDIVAGLVFFMTFAAYWISEWLKNTIHTTIAGVYGSWYFCSGNFPKGATRGAFKRSITYSFGSISLGSLIVAIINLLRQICSIAQQQDAQDGNIVGVILFCCLRCILALLDWVVEFVNRYAFITIALYGKPYFAAAKDTWRLIKNRGIDALVNLCLLGPVFSLGSVFVGFTSALFGFVYSLSIEEGYASGNFRFALVAFCFLIGVQICSIMVTPISSGVDTIFVAAAWDPEVLQRDHPDLYHEMLQVYPPLAQGIQA